MSSINWLLQQIELTISQTEKKKNNFNKKYEIAKQMHKKEIENAWNNGWESQPFRQENDFEDYYNQNFPNKI